MRSRGFGSLLQFMGLDRAFSRIRDPAEVGQDVPEPLRRTRLHNKKF